MVKRQKWTQEEDELLTALVKEQSKDQKDWKKIARRMSEMGHQKNRKQVFERWWNILDPAIDRHQLSTKDNERLFELQASYKNKWRELAKNFPGKTDNSLKNRFFSITRKAFRVLFKTVKPKASASWIGRLRSRFILDFLSSQPLMENKFQFMGLTWPKISVRQVLLEVIKRNLKSKAYKLSSEDRKIITFIVDNLRQASSNSSLPPETIKPVEKLNDLVEKSMELIVKSNTNSQNNPELSTRSINFRSSNSLISLINKSYIFPERDENQRVLCSQEKNFSENAENLMLSSRVNESLFSMRESATWPIGLVMSKDKDKNGEDAPSTLSLNPRYCLQIDTFARKEIFFKAKFEINKQRVIFKDEQTNKEAFRVTCVDEEQV